MQKVKTCTAEFRHQNAKSRYFNNTSKEFAGGLSKAFWLHSWNENFKIDGMKT